MPSHSSLLLSSTLLLLMDLLHLGTQARKTGIRPRQNLAKDKYNMEDVDEFFADDDDSQRNSSYKTQDESELHNVARKINFTDAEAASFKLSPIGLLSSSRRNRKSPLRSPLQDQSVSSQKRLFASDDSSFEPDFEPDYNDIGELSPVALDTLAPLSPPSPDISPDQPEEETYDSPPVRPTRKTKAAASLTKRMALGKTKKSRPPTVRKTNVPSKETITKPSPLPSPPPDGLRRSKRVKIAPLAFWRNERIVYSRADDGDQDPDSTLIRDIKKIPLQEIKEVVHIPEPAVDQPGHHTKRRSRLRSNTTTPKLRKESEKTEIYDYESDPEIAGSEWFQKKTKTAEIFTSALGDKESRVIAYSPDGANFDPPPQNTNGEEIRDKYEVATLFNMDQFTACGLLEFPFEGFKSLRTSGPSMFMCHVAKGLIEVTVSNDVFVVTRGCSFEIPKTNFYGFRNLGQDKARIFFVQMSKPDDDDDDE